MASLVESLGGRSAMSYWTFMASGKQRFQFFRLINRSHGIGKLGPVALVEQSLDAMGLQQLSDNRRPVVRCARSATHVIEFTDKG